MISRVMITKHKLHFLPIVQKRYSSTYFSYDQRKLQKNILSSVTNNKNIKNMSNTIDQKFDDIKEIANDMSKENMDKIIEQGTIQALNAFKIVNKKLEGESVSTTVTFNIGLIQISFTDMNHKIDDLK